MKSDPINIEKCVAAPSAEKTFADPELLSTLAHKLGHEIGNPLTAIISLSSVLQRIAADSSNTAEDKQLWEKVRLYADSMTHECWQIAGVNEKMVLLLSQRPIQDSDCDLVDVIERAISRLKNRQKFNLDLLNVAPLPETLMVAADSEQCLALIIELLSNAQRATESLQQHDQSLVLLNLSTEPKSGFAEICISNQCTGTHEFPLKQIFDPFVSDSPSSKRIGLGLTMVATIAQRFGGEVEVEERTANGKTLFTARVRLPLLQAPDALQTSSGPTSVLGSALPEILQILVIEDDAAVSSAIEKILTVVLRERSSVRCSIVDGNAALNLLGQGLEFNAILCDLNLPGTSGRHIYETLVARWPNAVPHFAFLSGEDPGGPMGVYLATSGRPFLKKPFEAEQLVNLVLRLVTAEREDEK